jgi:catechol 2,3-dioxygenase-like lactoylglutathione lyase family enzyme
VVSAEQPTMSKEIVPKLGYVVLYVEDLEKALEFYCGTLQIVKGMQMDNYVELETGNTKLSLVARSFVVGELPIELPSPGQGSFEVGLVVDRDEVRFSSRAFPSTSFPLLDFNLLSNWHCLGTC